MSHTRNVERQYNRWASIYDSFWRCYIRKTVPCVVERVVALAPATILDVGCGTGEFERLLLKQYLPTRLVGVDISEKMLEVARQKMAAEPVVSIQRAEARTLPFERDEFDCVVTASAFHYFDDPATTLEEMRRVVKPDGHLLLLDWCRDYFPCRVYDRVLHLFDPAYTQCYTVHEMERLLADAGFELRSRRTYSFDLVWGIMLLDAIPDL